LAVVAPLPPPGASQDGPALGMPGAPETLPAPGGDRKSPFAQFAKDDDDADERYSIDADSLKLKVVTFGKKAEIAEAMADGHVRLTELPSTQPAVNEKQPL